MDVLIAGGGIAGLALGIQLRQKGLNPVIIERQVGLRPQLKGEYFQPKGLEALQELRVLERFTSSNSSVITRCSHHYRHPLFGTRECFRFSYNPAHQTAHGLAATHEEILRILRSRYEELGGRLIEGMHIVDIEESSEGHEVILSSGQNFNARIFVGADGRYSPSRKILGLEVLEQRTPRYMLAALLQNIDVPAGEFYTEEVPGGVLYAFRYPDQTVRAYICMDEAELELCQKNRELFFLKKLRASSLEGALEPIFVEKPAMMPTTDSMMVQSCKGRAVWIGDAAGTVDPLGGHGMSLALTDACRLGELIAKHQDSNEELEAHLTRFSKKSQRDYLQARFVGLVIAMIFTSPSGLARLTKHRAVLTYKQDQDLIYYLADLFGGLHEGDLTFYDLPYILGFIPTRTRLFFSKLKMDSILSSAQAEILLKPPGLLRQQLKKRLFEKMT